MRLKEGLVLFLVFVFLLSAPLIVIIGEVSNQNSYNEIDKYPFNQPGTGIRFQFIGDFGDVAPDDPINGTDPVVYVSDVMKTLALKHPISFIISAGDNSYPHAYSDFDQVVYKLMYDIFNVEGLLGKPWYLVLGNHDCEVDSNFEVNANKLYPMWNMPQTYYNFTISIDQGNKVGLTFLDGCVLTGDDEALIKEQYNWLDQVLFDQDNDTSIIWKIVTIHMPLWSPGDLHGDNEQLKQSLYPYLFKYNVDLVLTGHEHLMAHYASRIINGQPQAYVPLPNINYTCNMDEYFPYNRGTTWYKGEAIHEVLNGAGGRDLYLTCPDKTTSMADLLYAFSSFGFNEIYIDSQIILVQYFNITDPNALYSFRIVI